VCRSLLVQVMGLAATKQEEFWEACGFGNTERVRKLIAEGIDVNWVSYTVCHCFVPFLCVSGYLCLSVCLSVLSVTSNQVYLKKLLVH